MLASHNNFQQIEQALLMASGQQVNELQIPEGMSIKEFQRQMKQDIIKKGAMRKLDTDMPSSVEALESGIYFQDLDLKQEFAGMIEGYKDDPILGPIDFLGFSVLEGNLAPTRKLTLFQQYNEIKTAQEEPAQEPDLSTQELFAQPLAP